MKLSINFISNLKIKISKIQYTLKPVCVRHFPIEEKKEEKKREKEELKFNFKIIIILILERNS